MIEIFNHSVPLSSLYLFHDVQIISPLIQAINSLKVSKDIKEEISIKILDLIGQE